METEGLLGGLERPGGAWSRLASWSGDARRLVAVSARGHGDRATQLLAYGLQRLEGRQLHLIVPSTAVGPTRARAAFLDATVHVHRARRAAIGDADPPMSRAEAVAFYRRLGAVTPIPAWDSSGWPAWLVELVDWLESRRVERVRTTEAHAWHYRGRQILHVRRSATDGAYRLIVGANYTAPVGDQPAPLRFRVESSDSPASDVIDRARTALDIAIDQRRTGADAGQREHLLQAAIGTDPSLIGLTHLRREFPAWRPGQRPRRGRGFIDFLGRDVGRTGHVVETKIGPDPQLGLQVLDYWAWSEAHRHRLSEVLGTDADRPFQLDIVLGTAGGAALHPAAAATLRRLGSDVDWRCHIVRDWDTIAEPGRLLTAEAEALRSRQLPG